ncbi:MAG: hypothetical protein ACI9W2_000468 [Gammaproteobacteria bacterium]|jgi:hypothetical protein
MTTTAEPSPPAPIASATCAAALDSHAGATAAPVADPRRRRRSYFVDAKAQRKIMHHVLRIVTAGIALGGMNVLIIDYYAGFLSATFGAIADATNTVLMATGAYLSLWLVLSYLTLHAFLVVFSHRIVGPEYKLRNRLAAMRDGQLDGYVKLRKKDFLQDLTRDINLTSRHFREMNSDIEVRVESVRSAIEAGESAETVLTQLDQVGL